MAFALPMLLLLALAEPAAETPIAIGDSYFFAQEGNGQQSARRDTTVIPLRMGSCYGWAIEAMPEARSATIREVFDLPGPGDWGSSPEEQDRAVSRNKANAVVEFQAPLNAGVISHVWCVSDGDPAGPHRIRVYHGETLLHDFRFTLEAQTDRSPTSSRRR